MHIGKLIGVGWQLPRGIDAALQRADCLMGKIGDGYSIDIGAIRRVPIESGGISNYSASTQRVNRGGQDPL